jgi:exodeoxyribonuclease-3
LQEVRALADEVPQEIVRLRSWHRHLVAAERRGYSGVGLLSRIVPDRVETALGIDRFDVEGRVQIASFGRLVVANVYFPKGSGRLRDNSRVPYKLDFYRCLFERRAPGKAETGRATDPRPWRFQHRPRADRPGAPARQREEQRLPPRGARRADALDRCRMDRHLPPLRARRRSLHVREKNVGWRIDYVLASPAAMPHVRAAFIQPLVTGSDHCPVGVDLDPRVLL